MSFSVEKLGDIEAHLANNPSLTEGGLPGPLDASIYSALGSNTFPIQSCPMSIPTQTPTTGISSSALSHPPLSRAGPTEMLPHPPPPLLPKRRPAMISISSATMTPPPRKRRSPRKSPKKKPPSPLQRRPRPSPSLNPSWSSR